jgi:hypothetical protein
MATQAGFNTTQADAAILASNISQYLVPTARSNYLYPLIAGIIDLRQNRSEVFDLPRWGTFQTVANQTETDEYSSSNVPLTAKSSITAADPGLRSLITDQALQDTGFVSSVAVNQMIEALRNYFDVQTLALITSATNTSNSSDVNLTLALWTAAKAAFKAQKPLGTMCFVGSTNQLRDFDLDLIQSGGGSLVQGAGLDIFQGAMVDGYRGIYNGVAIFESANVPEFDASNDSGAFFALQPGAGPKGETLSPFAMGVWEEIHAEGVRVPSRKGEDVTVTSRVGWQVHAQYWIREFVTKKAAA